MKLLKDFLKENINIPINIGDTILTGRFRNKKIVVKSIGKDERGLPTINGKTIVNFRIVKESFLNSDNLDKMIKFLNKKGFKYKLTDDGIKLPYDNQWSFMLKRYALNYNHKSEHIYDPSIKAIDYLNK